jgi:hypothetical protein
MMEQKQLAQEVPNVDREKVQTMFDAALGLAYEKGFDQLVDTFKGVTKPGPFSRRMAGIVVPLLDTAEAQVGGASDEELTLVGLLLVAQIYADMLEGEVIPDDKQMLQAALQMTAAQWLSSHPDRVDSEEFKQAAAMVGQQGQPPAGPPGNASPMQQGLMAALGGPR